MGTTLVGKLKAQAEDARRQAERLDKMVQLATELGDDGLSELVALLGGSGVTPDEATSAETGDEAVVHRTSNGRAYGNRYTAETPDIPRGREAVRRIVSERPGIWTLAEIRAEMKARGWFTTRAGLEHAAKRLCKEDGEGRHIGPGRYVFPANFGEEEVESTVPAEGEAPAASLLSLVSDCPPNFSTAHGRSTPTSSSARRLLQRTANCHPGWGRVPSALGVDASGAPTTEVCSLIAKFGPTSRRKRAPRPRPLL